MPATLKETIRRGIEGHLPAQFHMQVKVHRTGPPEMRYHVRCGAYQISIPEWELEDWVSLPTEDSIFLNATGKHMCEMAAKKLQRGVNTPLKGDSR